MIIMEINLGSIATYRNQQVTSSIHRSHAPHRGVVCIDWWAGYHCSVTMRSQRCVNDFYSFLMAFFIGGVRMQREQQMANKQTHFIILHTRHCWCRTNDRGILDFLILLRGKCAMSLAYTIAPCIGMNTTVYITIVCQSNICIFSELR